MRTISHAVGHFQVFHGLFQLSALITFNPTGDTTGARVVGHEYQVRAGQTDKGGQGGALVTTFFFIYLNYDFLAFTDHFFNAGTTLEGVTFGEVLAGDLFQWQKAWRSAP